MAKKPSLNIDGSCTSSPRPLLSVSSVVRLPGCEGEDSDHKDKMPTMSVQWGGRSLVCQPSLDSTGTVHPGVLPPFPCSALSWRGFSLLILIKFHGQLLSTIFLLTLTAPLPFSLSYIQWNCHPSQLFLYPGPAPAPSHASERDGEKEHQTILGWPQTSNWPLILLGNPTKLLYIPY